MGKVEMHMGVYACVLGWPQFMVGCAKRKNNPKREDAGNNSVYVLKSENTGIYRFLLSCTGSLTKIWWERGTVLCVVRKSQCSKLLSVVINQNAEC